jgi:hypothetical protein
VQCVRVSLLDGRIGWWMAAAALCIGIHVLLSYNYMYSDLTSHLSSQVPNSSSTIRQVLVRELASLPHALVFHPRALER